MQDMLDDLTEIARKAGEAILEVYQKEDLPTIPPQNLKSRIKQ